MQPVIYPVNKAKLLAELTEERFIRKTNKGGNEIYSFNAFNSPNLMKEVGRLRELTFRTAGGGTGKEVDIDPFDVDEQVPYQQLIVWDPKEQEILGGYRYILCDNLPLNQEGEPNLATTELFRFSEAFKKQYLTKMIELGRSFVQPLYQSTKMGRKSLFALDNLWDGLGALTVENPGMEYFFGKVTMYTSFNIEARDMILFFMRKYFKDTERLVEPITPLEIHIDDNKLGKILCGNNYDEDYRILSRYVREHGENIPPISKCLHEPVTFHEILWDSHKPGLWWCGRNSNSDQDCRCIRNQESPSHLDLYTSNTSVKKILIKQSRKSD